MRRHWRLLLGILAAVLLAIGVAGYVWLSDLADPMPETDAALASSDTVSVETEPWLTFSPAEPADTGFIFYPGGRVSAGAYAPPVRALADAGYLAVITPMPFGLAVLDANAADAVMATHPGIERWIIGGHSLGGAMAAQYAAGGAEIDGLALWAAYPPDGSDLSASDTLVASVFASEDGLATLDEIEASRALLPPDSRFVEIVGGNHAQFGWYGPQAGDGEATISRGSQQEQVVAATLELIEAVAAR